MTSEPFIPHTLLGIHLPADLWLRVLQCLYSPDIDSNLGDIIGDEIGLMISTHPRAFEPAHSCKDCANRDICCIRCAPPICADYYSYIVTDKKEDAPDD